MFVEEKAAGEAQTAEQRNRTLKISEAIRLGAAMRPQAFGTIWDSGKTCALGAAIEGRGFDPRRYTVEYQDEGRCGEYRKKALPEIWGNSISHEVVRLNDEERWSRERIADWLESQGY